MVEIHTPDELRALIATLLAGAAGGTEAAWARAIGPVVKLPIHSNVQSNWSIEPSGTDDELVAIGKAVELVRAQHRYVAG